MLKRKRDTDLPRAKRLRAASVSLLEREWIRKEVLAKDGVQRRADGTFSFTFRHGCVLTRACVDEIVRAVNTETEISYVRFYVNEEGYMVASIENEYPARSTLRREQRKDETDSWWKHLDLHEKNGEDATVDCVWSNELLSVPEYDRKCLLTVHPRSNAQKTPVIHVVRALGKC